VRYEQSVKQRQQKELAESIIAKIEKELTDPKVLKQILDQSVKDVERTFQLAITQFSRLTCGRHCFPKSGGIIEFLLKLEEATVQYKLVYIVPIQSCSFDGNARWTTWFLARQQLG
jgi:hypothetical protein